ncbi:MAG: LysR family transcriptional regulator [Chloroflexota bacterium]
MNLNQLRGFWETASERSMSRAADKLFLTQPALSLQIKALEEELGQTLFERQGRQLLLTDSGRFLQERAKEILDLVERTQQEVATYQNLERGRITIGTNDTNCLYLLPSLLSTFREAFPGIELSLTNRKTSEVAALVISGEVDFGIGTLPIPEPRITTETLCWREDVAICSYSHPLVTNQQVTLGDLAEYTLLMLEQGSSSRGALERMMAERGVIPKMTMDLGSIEVIKRFVEINLGIGIVPGIAVADEVKAKRLRAFRLDWLPPSAIGILQRRNGYLSPASQLFLKMLKNHVPNVLLCPL